MNKPSEISTIHDLEKVIAGRRQQRKSEIRPVLTVSAGTCGRARGSLRVVNSLKKAIKTEKLEDKVVLRVT